MLSLTGLDFIPSISGAASSLSNVGPGLGSEIGPNSNYSGLPDQSKWLLSIGMILGIVALLLTILSNKKNRERMSKKLEELTIVNELSLTIGLIMLTIGNFLGGMWANESW